MNKTPQTDDLHVFLTVARTLSFAETARRLHVSPAYVSKRLGVLEADLKIKLLHRTTRKVVVTPEGERALVWALRILDGVDQLVQELGSTRQEPQGLLRITSSFGFGRNVLAPAVSRLVRAHPRLQIRLELVDRQVDAAAEGFDLDVRIGDDIAPHLIARQLAGNFRVLCAAPSYVQRRGQPRHLADLGAHDCLAVQERDHPFGTWQMQCGVDTVRVKVTGPLSINDGEVAVRWALDGHGIVLRSMWDVSRYLATGQLIQVLPEWRQTANVWAVYPSRLQMSAKVRVAVEFLHADFMNAGLLATTIADSHL